MLHKASYIIFMDQMHCIVKEEDHSAGGHLVSIVNATLASETSEI